MNVSERDFLRTEGDPGGAGYTIKEAATLIRSMVSSLLCRSYIGAQLIKCLSSLLAVKYLVFGLPFLSTFVST